MKNIWLKYHLKTSAWMLLPVVILYFIPSLSQEMKIFTLSSWIFFFLLTALLYYINMGSHKESHQFLSKVFISLGLKLLVCAGFVLGYALIFKPKEKLFIFPFLVLYIGFTFFETRFISTYTRVQK